MMTPDVDSPGFSFFITNPAAFETTKTWPTTSRFFFLMFQSGFEKVHPSTVPIRCVDMPLRKTFPKRLSFYITKLAKIKHLIFRRKSSINDVHFGCCPSSECCLLDGPRCRNAMRVSYFLLWSATVGFAPPFSDRKSVASLSMLVARFGYG